MGSFEYSVVVTSFELLQQYLGHANDQQNPTTYVVDIKTAKTWGLGGVNLWLPYDFNADHKQALIPFSRF